MTQELATNLVDRLNESPVHRKFADHDFFARVTKDDVTKEQVGTFLGQWWYPLHYFPTFLAQCVASLPDIESKSAITRILNQEAGGGDPKAAHEVIYADSMEKAGFDRDLVTNSAPFEETAALVAGYEKAAKERYSALGFIFATEVTDLLMVSSIGSSVKRVTGRDDNEWVSIHVEQEPDHVEEANHAMLEGFGPEEQEAVLASAEEMWTLWTRFFDRLSQETGVGTPYPDAVSVVR
ncbi:TenA family transcriptional regulator [Streptomyces sp. NPDC054796]